MQCELEKELILYPRHFGPNLKNFLTEKLIAKVDHALPRHGLRIKLQMMHGQCNIFACNRNLRPSNDKGMGGT